MVWRRPAFDALGRLTVVTNALGAFTNGYADLTPRISSVAYPNGQTVSYGYYDNPGDQRLRTILNQNAGGTAISRFDYVYDAEGQITQWTEQADAQTPSVWTMQNDAADQLLGVSVQSPAGAILKRFAYNYDLMGNRTSEQIDSNVSQAGYNGLNELINAAVAGWWGAKGASTRRRR